MPLRRVRTPVEQFEPFERDCIVGLWEAQWNYQRIAAYVGHNVSVLCRTSRSTHCTCCVTKDHWETPATAGLRSRVPLARLPLTPRHREARRERVDWRVEWRSVFFNDESRFCLYASDGRTRLRRRPGERHLPECIQPPHTGPISGLTVWGPSVTTRGHIWCFCRVK